jgi:pteridine reductase
VDWHGFYADLADGEGLAALIDDVARHFGRPPDLLVNNASAFEYDDAQTVTPAALAHHHAVNAVAPVILATELARHLGRGIRPVSSTSSISAFVIQAGIS